MCGRLDIHQAKAAMFSARVMLSLIEDQMAVQLDHCSSLLALIMLAIYVGRCEQALLTEKSQKLILPFALLHHASRHPTFLRRVKGELSDGGPGHGRTPLLAE